MDENDQLEPEKAGPSWLWLSASVLTGLLALLVSYAGAFIEGLSPARMAGRALVAVMAPLIVMFLFRLIPRCRGPRAQAVVFTSAALIVLFTSWQSFVRETAAFRNRSNAFQTAARSGLRPIPSDPQTVWRHADLGFEIATPSSQIAVRHEIPGRGGHSWILEALDGRFRVVTLAFLMQNPTHGRMASFAEDLVDGIADGLAGAEVQITPPGVAEASSTAPHSFRIRGTAGSISLSGQVRRQSSDVLVGVVCQSADAALCQSVADSLREIVHDPDRAH